MNWEKRCYDVKSVEFEKGKLKWVDVDEKVAADMIYMSNNKSATILSLYFQSLFISCNGVIFSVSTLVRTGGNGAKL